MALRVGRISPSTIFGLLGQDENSATFAIGWALERCWRFRQLVLADIAQISIREHDEFSADLQRHADDGGFTDIEIRVPNSCHIIIEAKKGWQLPESEQLNRYANRLRGASGPQIVSVSAASQQYALRNQREVGDGIACRHRAWSDLRKIAERAQRASARHEEKLWLRELVSHLREFEYMSRIDNNLVYVVSLGTGSMREGKPDTWIDVVNRDHRYFHPVGNRWPVEPPNYIGFRYYGRLQSVHHIDEYEVVRDVSTISKSWVRTDDDHFVYQLGPAMRPPMEVKSGPLWHRREWCAIDTLLSGAYATITAAREETKRRENS